jgi:hypothetical protein
LKKQQQQQQQQKGATEEGHTRTCAGLVSRKPSAELGGGTCGGSC